MRARANQSCPPRAVRCRKNQIARAMAGPFDTKKSLLLRLLLLEMATLADDVVSYRLHINDVAKWSLERLVLAAMANQARRVQS